ncbi:MAG: NAD(P)/FAD-dependent oxidoreductase [Actinobacteria bacterium]|nr:NAD(P)/FAD-dependent oxidoreductase [Actinomycetota bacterium]
MKEPNNTVGIIGAGPGGLTAAYWLETRYQVHSEIFEATNEIGGISQTVLRNGWRFDIGGHRFFTKVETVSELWHEILPDGDFILRPRMSRIYYRKKFFDYPLKAFNALFGLGIIEAVACVASYVAVRINPPKDQSSFETWVAARFGWRLYRIFFKTYTEKVWGIPASSIQADWAAQRIKNLDLKKAILNALKPSGKRGNDITSLIEEFEYPKLGPGMMWEVCAEKVTQLGSTLTMNQEISKVIRNSDGTVTIQAGSKKLGTYTNVISTMPINILCQVMEPAPPKEVVDAAGKLKHRDFLTVALVVPEKYSFPDNWIYIHSPEVRLGRVQNFASWSPYMIKEEGYTCLGLEYFVNEGDDLWSMDDAELVKFGASELEKMGLVPASTVKEGHVVRMPKAYPVYDEEYGDALETIRSWLSESAPNIHPVGRNGMHRYNNADHSMMTAILTAENIAGGADNDIWAVNVEDDYHEAGEKTSLDLKSGTGRSAPTFVSKG